MTVPTISSGSPPRPNGVLARIGFMNSSDASTAAFMGVRKNPGAMALTLVLCFAHPLAAVRVSCPTAPLLARQDTGVGWPMKESADAVLMMHAPPCGIIFRAAAPAQRDAALAFTAITR